VIFVGPDGARSIVHHPGTASVPDVSAVDADWVHVDHAGYGHASGRLSVDAGNPIATLDLRGVALYVPTEERLAADYGEAAAALAAGAEVVVVTRGAGGSSATSADGTIDAPGVACDGLVSTLGAGDVFHGALLAWLVRGTPLGDALRAANVAASLSCRALDGRSAIPTLTELKARL
jgi:sugar/nucleoside kinase (ribokinase family)